MTAYNDRVTVWVCAFSASEQIAYPVDMHRTLKFGDPFNELIPTGSVSVS